MVTRKQRSGAYGMALILKRVPSFSTSAAGGKNKEHLLSLLCVFLRCSGPVNTAMSLSVTSERMSDLDGDHSGLHADDRPVRDSSLCCLCPCERGQVHQTLGEG